MLMTMLAVMDLSICRQSCNADEYVIGYALAIDLTARDLQVR